MNFRNISAWSIRNPVIPIVFFIGLVIAGIVSFIRMDVNQMPDVEFPAVIVTISQPGAAPTEIETQITQKVEAAARSISGVEEISSTASEGNSQTMVQFSIGTDIDDAYALVGLIRRTDLEVLGVTTVSSDAAARARLAAKLLSIAGGKWSKVPVYAGISTPAQYMKQVEWADGFESPSLHASGGVEFMRREINARPGEITLIAVGELTNVAEICVSEVPNCESDDETVTPRPEIATDKSSNDEDGTLSVMAPAASSTAAS